jgi:hypothetical protein
MQKSKNKQKNLLTRSSQIVHVALIELTNQKSKSKITKESVIISDEKKINNL